VVQWIHRRTRHTKEHRMTTTRTVRTTRSA
jgi:hypothetical protein